MSTENVTQSLADASELLKQGLTSVAKVRQAQEWRSEQDKVTEHGLKRLEAVSGSVLHLLQEPNVASFFFATDAEELRRNAAAFRQATSDYETNPPSLLNAAWAPLSAVLAVARNAGGMLSPPADRPSQAIGVALEQAIVRLQRLNTDTEVLRNLQQEVASQNAELKVQVQGQLVEHTTAFLKRQAEQEDTFQQAIRNARVELDELKSQHLTAVDSFSNETRAALAAINSLHETTVANIKAQEAKASAAVGAVGETGQAAGFEQTARDAARRALWWQAGTLVTMGAVVAIAAITLFWADPFVPNAGGIAAIATKVVLVFGLGIVSRYCAAMADRERRENLWAKQRGLEFRALNAYLENLDAQSRVAMREKLLDKYFGVGSTLLTEVASQGPVATGSHDAAAEGVKFLLERLPKGALVPLLAAVLPKAEREPEKPPK